MSLNDISSLDREERVPGSPRIPPTCTLAAFLQTPSVSMVTIAAMREEDVGVRGRWEEDGVGMFEKDIYWIEICVCSYAFVALCSYMNITQNYLNMISSSIQWMQGILNSDSKL